MRSRTELSQFLRYTFIDPYLFIPWLDSFVNWTFVLYWSDLYRAPNDLYVKVMDLVCI